MFIVALHLYTPPWDVRMPLKVNIVVDMPPIVDCVPIDIPAVFTGSLHSRIGVVMRYSSTEAVQVMV